MNMNANYFLSYTHGHTLLTLLGSISDSLHDREHNEIALKNAYAFATQERRRIRRAVTNEWPHTISQFTYDAYLGDIEKMLTDYVDAAKVNELMEAVDAHTRKTIELLILTQEPSCWPSLESLFYAASANERYHVSLVYTPFEHKDLTEQVDYYDTYREEMNLPVIRHSEYQLHHVCPDIVVMVKPYSGVPAPYRYEHLKQRVPRVVYIPYGMEITTDLAQFGYQYPAQRQAWRHCAYGEVVREYGKTYGYRNAENIVVWGHPKGDHYRRSSQEEASIPLDWISKIAGKKTILWTPHHLVNLEENGTGTWLLYGRRFLEFALEYKEVAFILRPHPMMFGALVHQNRMSEKQVEELKERIRNSDHIILDESNDYRTAFDAADAIITDGTTFSIEWLYTGKPIMLTPRNMESFFHYEEMLASYYVGRSAKDMANYVQMIAAGEDPLRKARLDFQKKRLFIPRSCTIGENIARNIARDLDQELSHLPMLVNGKYEYEHSVSYKTTSEDLFIPDKDDYPLFSVLVLCYKNCNLLWAMLDTIFAQTYPRIQLVVSDDGSADFDVTKVENYIRAKKKQNIESFVVRKNEKNMGTVAHIQEAHREIQGEYFVFTAADDRFMGTDILTSYVEQFLKFPKSLWLVAKANMVSEDYKKKLYVTPTAADDSCFKTNDSRKIFSRWSRRGMAIPCQMAFRKEAIEFVGGFDPSYKYLEDWPVVLKLLRSGHAPIYYQRVTAIHSTGGISNSNARYGIALRKAFFDDKATIFRKEVNPYIHLLSKEDHKAYKQYLREFQKRHYFFYITWPQLNKTRRILHLALHPVHFWWYFELQFVKRNPCKKLPKKKLFMAAQVLLVVAALLSFRQDDVWFKGLLDAIAFMEVIVAVGATASVVLVPLLDKWFKYKAELRKKLVN